MYFKFYFNHSQSCTNSLLSSTRITSRKLRVRVLRRTLKASNWITESSDRTRLLYSSTIPLARIVHNSSSIILASPRARDWQSQWRPIVLDRLIDTKRKLSRAEILYSSVINVTFRSIDTTTRRRATYSYWRFGMSSNKVGGDLSITVMTFYMKIVGFWIASNYVEERRRNLTISYTFFAIFFAMATEARDLYFSWGNFGVSRKIWKGFLDWIFKYFFFRI